MCFWTWKYKVNLSRKNFWTSPDRALELLATNLLSLLFFLFLYSYVKRIQCGSWTSRSFQLELLSRFFVQPLSHEFLNFLGLSTWTCSNKTFSVCFFHSFLIQNAHRVVRELLAVINLNFSRLRENIMVDCIITADICVFKKWSCLMFIKTQIFPNTKY